jgi:hypothetical protein
VELVWLDKGMLEVEAVLNIIPVVAVVLEELAQILLVNRMVVPAF